jgi:hypothetical protein
MTQKILHGVAQVISFGPFVDETDGVTLQTGLVSAIDHTSTGIKLSKNGGALTVRNGTPTASSYDSYGNYLVTLNATDTNTIGPLLVQFADATTNLVVWKELEVVVSRIPGAIHETTIASVASNTSFTLTNGPTIGSMFTGDVCVIFKPTTLEKMNGALSAYTGVSKTVTLTENTNSSYTVAVGDIIAFFPEYGLKAGALANSIVSMSSNQPTVNVGRVSGTTQTAGDLYGLWTTAMADSVPSDGTRPSPVQALYMAIQFLLERAVSGTTCTVKKVDGSTTLLTLTLNDADNPTSITRTG